MSDALENILVARRRELKRSQERVPLAELERMVLESPPPVPFFQAVSQKGRISVIAEMKKKSPSAGLIRENYDVADIAMAYEKGGASALSVLTEKDYFGGDVEELGRVRKVSRLPLLRKDFIFDPYQILEARVHGADAVLLIADMLPGGLLKELTACAQQYQLEPLVEVFTSDVVPAALNSGCKVIGINARNLRTLEMKEENVFLLARLIPNDRVIVAESGIKTAADVERLKSIRVSAILVGESLLREADPAQTLRALVEAGMRQ